MKTGPVGLLSMDTPHATRTEQPSEPLLEPSAADGYVDDRIAAPHVGELSESLEEPFPGDPDLFRFVGGSDQLQALPHLSEGDDLAADAFP